MSQKYPPIGETIANLQLERADIAENVVAGAAYGLHLCVFFAAMYFIVKSPPGSKKVGIPFAILTCLLFALGTCQIVISTVLDEIAWMNYRNYPGGPMAWIQQNFDITANTAQDAAYVVANFLADGAMIYRLYVIWDGNIYVLIVPALSYLATTALAILSLIQFQQPGGSFWTHATVQFFVPFWFLTISLNVLLTLLIVVRLLYVRRTILSVLGAEHARTYTSIITILVESSAIFSITGVIYIICFKTGSSVQTIVLGVLDQCVCIAPELIVLRVAQGRGWTRNTSQKALTTFEVRKNVGRPSANHSEGSGTMLICPPSRDGLDVNLSKSTFAEKMVNADAGYIA